MSENSQEPILVGVDFSIHSAAAIDWAARAAQRFDAPLIVLHVVHDPASAPGYYARSDAGGRPRLQEDVAKEMLDEFVQKAAKRNPELNPRRVRTMHVVGLPATRIIEVAEAEGAQLIVVGSQGRTGLAHVLLGSKAERVAQLSPLPVTIVKSSG